jgi:hypothetical protein
MYNTNRLLGPCPFPCGRPCPCLCGRPYHMGSAARRLGRRRSRRRRRRRRQEEQDLPISLAPRQPT